MIPLTQWATPKEKTDMKGETQRMELQAHMIYGHGPLIAPECMGLRPSIIWVWANPVRLRNTKSERTSMKIKETINSSFSPSGLRGKKTLVSRAPCKTLNLTLTLAY